MIVLAALVGYLLGAVSPATLFARRAGADLRASGSGNPGATNAGRLLGRRVGVVVALLDVAKGWAPAFLASLLVSHRAGLVAGFAAVLGHITSPYLRGHGGKGVATAGGAVLGSHPAWAPFVLGVWVGTVLLTKWVALGSVLAALTLPVLAFGSSGADLVWACVVALVVIARHRRNFVHRSRRRPPSTDPLP